MSKAIYPYKFVPVPHERVWGGERLVKACGRPFDEKKKWGESWEISGFAEDSSVISEGYLAENSLFDVIETYMEEVVGEDNYKRFGNEFPLLVKMLDVQERLSVQVHPDDDTAFDRHGSYGKTEAWYILEADPDAVVYMGFNRDIAPAEFLERCKNGTLEEVLNCYHPQKGDFFYIESGIVHSAGGGLLIAEIQQLSDVTYRIYDWGRENDPATAREMHLEYAFDCICYDRYDPVRYFVPAAGRDVQERCLTENKYFKITERVLTGPKHVEMEDYQSFILYYSVSGTVIIRPDKEAPACILKQGEWVLVPAAMSDFMLEPFTDKVRVLESYVALQEVKDSYIDDGEDCSCGASGSSHHKC